MKRENESNQGYINDLEDKIVDLSIVLKAKKNELNSCKNAEMLLLKQFIHNLKNPVGNIVSFSNMILDFEQDVSSEKMQKFVKIIHNSSNFSLKLLTRFSEYVTIKNNTEIQKNININVYKVILNEIENLKNYALEKNIAIEFKAKNEHLEINADCKSLGVIANNLIHNALRFSADNSEVIIELEEVADTVEIRIKDKGIGIAKDNLPTIFNEFFVCNTYDLAQDKCIGLGLSISKLLTKHLNGNITIKSEINKGTTILLSFKKC